MIIYIIFIDLIICVTIFIEIKNNTIFLIKFKFRDNPLFSIMNPLTIFQYFL